MQHGRQIYNSPCTPVQSVRDLGSAALVIKSAQRLEFALARLWHNPLHTGSDLRGQISEEFSAHTGHIAGDNQIPLLGIGREQRSLNAGKRAAIGKQIGHGRQSQVPIQIRGTDEADRVCHSKKFFGNVLGQGTSFERQQSLVTAHSRALSPHQNEARKPAVKHLQMVPLQYVIQRLRPALLVTLGMQIWLPLAMHAETVASRTTITVRADAHTGRLVRSVVVSPRILNVDESSAPVQARPASSLPPAKGTLAAENLTDMINEIAERNQVEPSLVHSVIKAESNYNPAALSPKGAQGLMQLIPSTARRFGVSNSYNVQENVEGGVKYLKFLIDLYHNDYKKVIAAYNAGEGAVAKYGGIPPYSETMTYVYRVAKNLKTARQYAEIRAADRKLTAPPPPPVQAAGVQTEQETHPIVAVTGEDGKVYYKTQ